MSEENTQSLKGDGNVYCYLCEKEIGVYPDSFSVFYDKADNNEPKALHKKCLAKVIKISQSSFSQNEC